ncbi:hypothetical protein NMY22_g18944 [Coprinellus aureogranulatus]|nr:hypothetical protein NMY22_g18944 [Coprinellus aureogranulatus]
MLAKSHSRVPQGLHQPVAEEADAGPSRDKGKGPDPSNWGELNLNPDEVDVDLQRAALEQYNQAHRKATQDAVPPSDLPPRPTPVPGAHASRSFNATSEYVELAPMHTRAFTREQTLNRLLPINGMDYREASGGPDRTRRDNQVRSLGQVAPNSYLANALRSARDLEVASRGSTRPESRFGPSSSPGYPPVNRHYYPTRPTGRRPGPPEEHGYPVPDTDSAGFPREGRANGKLDVSPCLKYLSHSPPSNESEVVTVGIDSMLAAEPQAEVERC